MFNFKKDQKTVFSKLYRYYCRKLLKLWWLILFYLLIIGVCSLPLFFSDKNPNSNFLLVIREGNWMEKFRQLWLISLTQLVLMFMLVAQTAVRLTGRETSWGTVTMKRNRANDIKVLLFTPQVSRETVIWAKFAAAATYFWVVNFFLLTLPLFFFLWFVAGVSALLLVSFLLLNGVIFALINFLSLAPSLFFLYEDYSILFIVILFVLIIIFQVIYYSFKDFLTSSTIVPFLSIPLFLAIGSFFFYLYRKRFLKNDLD